MDYSLRLQIFNTDKKRLCTYKISYTCTQKHNLTQGIIHSKGCRREIMLQISLAISRQLPRQINLVSQNSNGDELHSASTSNVCAFFLIKQMAYAIKYDL